VLAPPYIEEAARLLPGESIDHFFSVPHFTDVERFHPTLAEERRAARRRFDIPEDAFVVLCIGPLGTASGKRMDHVAEELSIASSRALLVSAGANEQGSDEVRGRITRALGPRALLLGRVDRSRVAELHGAADVFALGTLGEPFSIAIAEALASGVPVVHHRDPITNWVAGAGGVAVSMSTRGEAAKVLQRLEVDAAWRSSLGAAGRKLAVERYSPGPVCAALEREWRRIALRTSSR
jgi:1,2-diacylglycerol-3-alpha-glucose alpha-1,2-galactosyltransferase